MPLPMQAIPSRGEGGTFATFVRGPIFQHLMFSNSSNCDFYEMVHSQKSVCAKVPGAGVWVHSSGSLFPLRMCLHLQDN